MDMVRPQSYGIVYVHVQACSKQFTKSILGQTASFTP